MLQILNWDFLYKSSGAASSVFSGGVRQDNDSPKRSEVNLVQVSNSPYILLFVVERNSIK